ncbi:DUF222 domain-containing protein [Streptomyces sp. 8N616]|uniref:DUF222 domain-containing protein n=1 Tax=Streptomyces sp. 8N616 TaxID=3457414 RepID=UPI003FD0DA30
MGAVSAVADAGLAEAGVVEAGPGTPDEWAGYLAGAVPGPETASLLAVLDAEKLSGAGRIDALRALERHAEWVQALQVRVLAALDTEPVEPFPGEESPAEGVWDFTCEQVACALRISNTTAATRLATARELVGTFTPTLGLLEAGRIHYMQANAVVEVTQNLPRATAAQVEALVAERMPGQAVSATRKALHRAVLKADPEGARARHEGAKKDRKISRRMDQDGMAWWSVYVPAEQAAQLDAAVDAHAEIIRSGREDTRSLEQRRVDALVDLVVHHSLRLNGTRLPRGGPGRLVPVNRTGGHADQNAVQLKGTRRRVEGSAVQVNGTSDDGRTDGGVVRLSGTGGRSAPVVQVTVSFDTLIGATDDPAELKGYGPITAGQARALATEPGSIWRRLITQPTTGMLIKTDPTTYRPTAETARHVIARDGRCAFPSCQMPAHRCDLDHVQPFNHQAPENGGHTTPENLIPLCRRHHLLKHHGGWSVERDNTNGHAAWTAPTGHTYTNTPHTYAA